MARARSRPKNKHFEGFFRGLKFFAQVQALGKKFGFFLRLHLGWVAKISEIKLFSPFFGLFFAFFGFFWPFLAFFWLF